MKLIAKTMMDTLIAFQISGRIFFHGFGGFLLRDDDSFLLRDDTSKLIITDPAAGGPIHTVRKEQETTLTALDRIN